MATWILFLALLGQGGNPDSWDHTRREWRGELRGRTCLEISNPLGSVTTRPGDDGVVPLIAHLQSRTGTEVPELLLDATPGECMILEVRPPSSGDPGESGARVDLGLRLPPSLDRIDVVTTTGEIRLLKPSGAVRARSTTGDIVATPRRSIVASTERGRVEISAGPGAGGSELTSVSGEIRVRVEPDTDLELAVTARQPPRVTGACHRGSPEPDADPHVVICGSGGPRLIVRTDEGRVEVLG